MKSSIINKTLKNSPEIIEELGKRLYDKITEVIQSEVAELTEQDCIEYMIQLVVDRTFDGYKTEIETIYGQLEGAIGLKIEPAPDNWDRSYCVDFYIKVKAKYLGIQIKPVESGIALNNYQWVEMHKKNHQRFEKDFGGKVFFVYSTKVNGKKRIYNVEVIEQIKSAIAKIR